jgi:UTP--glucose-1-phosphate uridylyltransferase
VIPVAGIGTRFLPATKAQPKEMMPILDKPTIQYIVEGAVKAGITDIILVTGATKRAIEDHFDRNIHLEEYCLARGKNEACEAVRVVSEMANFIYIRQKGPYGTGTPVLNAKDLIGDEPFAVVYGDDIWQCPGKSHLTQLIETYQKYGDPVITAYQTDDAGTKKYGILEGLEVEAGVYQVSKLLEKPGPDKTASRLASISGYILTPDIFEELEKMLADVDLTKPNNGSEFCLTDALSALMLKRPIYAKLIEGKYHDVGSKFTWLKANIEFGLEDKEIGKDLKEFLKTLVK